MGIQCLSERARRASLPFLAIVLSSAMCSSLYSQTAHLPTPTGQFGVGMEQYVWIDSNRPETFTADKRDRREVHVSVYYPAGSVDGSPTIPYLDAWTARHFARDIGNRPFESVAASVATHTVLNASVAEGASPFRGLVFSPGFDTPPQLYTSMLEDLASQGYVVASVLHPFISGWCKLSSGKVAKPIAPSTHDPTEVLSIVVADQRFVLDRLRMEHAAGSGDLLAGRVDWDRVVVFGHSYGGATSLETALEDDRILAALNYDGPLYGAVGQVGLQKPFLVVQSEQNAQQPSWSTLLQNAPVAAWRGLLNGSDHYSFSDYDMLANASQDDTARAEMARLINRTFIGVQFMSLPESALDDLAAAHPEANLRQAKSP